MKYKYGGLDLEIINSKSDLVPKDCVNIMLEESDKQALAIAINENLPVLLIGEAGTGKTSIVREICYYTKRPYITVNMTGFTSPDELIGSKSVKDGRTYYELGLITNAMVKGATICLDEINATSPDCLFILHGLLDKNKIITLPNGEIIKPHKDFRVFATCNPNYEGTHGMNKAFIDRFPIILEIDVLEPQKEIKLLSKVIDKSTATYLVMIATMARKEYLDNKILTYVSTRSLQNVARLISTGLTISQAYKVTIVNKSNNKEEQKILLEFFNSVYKLPSKIDNDNTPYITTLREIKNLQDQVSQNNKKLSTQEQLINEMQLQKDELQGIINIRNTAIIKTEEKIIALEKIINQQYQDIRAYENLKNLIKKVKQNYGS